MPYLYSSGVYLPPPPPGGAFLPPGNATTSLFSGLFGQTPTTPTFHPNLLFNAHLAMLNQNYSDPLSTTKYHPVPQRFWPYPVVPAAPGSSSSGTPLVPPELRSPMSAPTSPYEGSHFKPSSSPGSEGGASSVGSCSSSDLKSMENMVNGLERRQGMPVTLSTLRDK